LEEKIQVGVLYEKNREGEGRKEKQKDLLEGLNSRKKRKKLKTSSSGSARSVAGEGGEKHPGMRETYEAYLTKPNEPWKEGNKKS